MTENTYTETELNNYIKRDKLSTLELFYKFLGEILKGTADERIYVTETRLRDLMKIIHSDIAKLKSEIINEHNNQ